jgi:hypothetical protein
MGVTQVFQTAFARLRHDLVIKPRFTTVLAVGVAAASLSIGIAEAAVRVQAMRPLRLGLTQTAIVAAGSAPDRLDVAPRMVWRGADLDGDGQPDIANPTGQAPRTEDAYGEGCFHARRDGGTRDHEGVDYVATAGQTVEAPISGYVAKIGYAYGDDQTLKFVEIDNPALHMTARVFYVDPAVEVGEAVAIGRPIGTAHSLQKRYPLGITDHVHLELADAKGRKLDAERLIVARTENGVAMGD